MDRLAKKVAFVTGAGSGIGRSAALRFVAEGAAVVIADLSVSAGEETVRTIEALGGTSIFVETDVTEPESVERSIAGAVERFGRLDILYNNAGGSTPRDGLITEVAVEEFWRAIKVDLFGTWLGCKYAIPHMIKAGGGSIINTASMVAIMGLRGFDAYTPAKGGVVALTRSLAVEYGDKNVRVNAIAPGMVLTDRGRKSLAAGRTPQYLVERQLVGFVEPDDIANFALYLASDESRSVTGQIIQIDSGATIS